MKTRTYTTMVVSLALCAANLNASQTADQQDFGSPFIRYETSGGILPSYDRVLIHDDLSVRAYSRVGTLAKRATGKISRWDYMAYAVQIRQLSQGIDRDAGRRGGADQKSFKLEANWKQHSVNLTGLEADKLAASLRAQLTMLHMQIIGGELVDENVWLELVTPPLTRDLDGETARGMTILRKGKLVLWKLDHRGVKQVVQRRKLSAPERQAFRRLVHDHRITLGKDSFGKDKKDVGQDEPGRDDFSKDKGLGASAPDRGDFSYDKQAVIGVRVAGADLGKDDLGMDDPGKDSFGRDAEQPPIIIIDYPALERESFLVPVDRNGVHRRAFRYDLREAAPEKSGLKTLADWVLVRVLIRAMTF